jgi:hypothetical protein
MAQRFLLVLVVLIFNSIRILGQDKLNQFPNRPDALRIELSKSPVNMVVPQPLSMISADTYMRHFGYFCKKELQIQKAIQLPLFFRLGNLEYVNRLEGKGIGSRQSAVGSWQLAVGSRQSPVADRLSIAGSR